MGTLYERIIDLCKMKGVSGSRMCLDLSLSKSTLSDMKYGRTKGVSMKTAQKIADYFGITVDELYGIDGKEEKENPATETGSGISKDDMDLLKQFHEADENTKDAIRLLLKL